MFYLNRVILGLCAPILLAWLPARAMTINYNFVPSSGVTTEPAQLASAFAGVAAMYASDFSDPITVNINVTFGTIGSNSGESTPTVFAITDTSSNAYAEIRQALLNDATTPVDAIATAHLPATEPSIFDGLLPVFTSAEGNALGADATGYGPDGVITLNTSFYTGGRYYFRGNGSIGSTQYDLWALLMHETDEVLGTFSILNLTAGGQPAYLSYYTVADLFRYDSSGRSLTPSTSEQAFFSIDATTPIVRYNQSGLGDYGDFQSGCPANPRVQDWSDCANRIMNLGPDEITLLDAIGYNSVPELGTLPLLALGLALIAAAAPRRNLDC